MRDRGIKASMSSNARKPHFSKDQRECERRSRDIQALADRNPHAWIPIGRDVTNIAAVELLQARGVLELDDVQTRFRLKAR